MSSGLKGLEERAVRESERVIDAIESIRNEAGIREERGREFIGAIDRLMRDKRRRLRGGL